MATAAELLAAGVGSEKVLTIDSDLRTISIPAGFGVFGVESDDDVLRVHFRGPRYYHDIDLSTFDLRVNIKNAKNQEDSYPVTDVTVDGNDAITFSWLIGRFTAQYRGDIKFSLCFRELDTTTGDVLREFNTTPATGKILEGLETSEYITQNYPDILGGILLRLESLEENGIPAGSLDTTLSVEGKAADAAAVGAALNSLGSNIATQMVITLNSSTGKASHTFAEILEHVNKGGSAVVKSGSSNYPVYLSLYSTAASSITFSNVHVGESVVTRSQCTIFNTDNYQTETVEMTKGISDDQAAQIQTNTEAIAAIQNPVKSGNLIIESNKYTMNLTMEDDSVETHVLETDENGYPAKLTVNGREITWTTTEV